MYDINDSFRENQKLLLRLANNSFGRKYLGIETDKKIVAISPDAYYSFIGNKTEANIFTGPMFAKKLQNTLLSLDVVGKSYAGLLNYCGLLKNNRFPYVLARTREYLPTGQEGTLWADWEVNQKSWNAVVDEEHTGTSLSYVGDTTQICSSEKYNYSGADYWLNRRVSMPFDTSKVTSLPSTTTLKIYLVSIIMGSSYINLYPSQQHIPIVLDDYFWCGYQDTQMATAKYAADWTLNDWNTFTFNADGRNAVAQKGTSKFTFRTGSDVGNSEPTNNKSFIVFYSSNGALSAKLTVTFPTSDAALMGLL